MANRKNEKIKQSGPRSTAAPGPLSSLRSVSQGASAMVIVVGCLVLIGWTLSSETLKSVFAGLSAMNPTTTAIAFILAGVSLWLLRAEQADQRRLCIAQGCALAVALVSSLLKLVEVLGSLYLGIDQLLFRITSAAPKRDSY